MFSMPALAPTPSELTSLQRSGRGILVVDDAEMIRSMIGCYSRQHGVPCYLAGDGAEAVKLYREHAVEIALVLLDVRLPGLDGPHTFAQLKAHDPNIACYFMSADWRPYTEEDLLEMGARGVLTKPFVIPALSAILEGLRADRREMA